NAPRWPWSPACAPSWHRSTPCSGTKSPGNLSPSEEDSCSCIVAVARSAAADHVPDTWACPPPPNPSSVHLQRPIPRQAVDRPRNPSRDSPMTFAKRCLFAFFALLLPLAAAAQEQGL